MKKGLVEVSGKEKISGSFHTFSVSGEAEKRVHRRFFSTETCGISRFEKVYRWAENYEKKQKKEEEETGRRKEKRRKEKGADGRIRLVIGGIGGEEEEKNGRNGSREEQLVNET